MNTGNFEKSHRKIIKSASALTADGRLRRIDGAAGDGLADVQRAGGRGLPGIDRALGGGLPNLRGDMGSQWWRGTYPVTTLLKETRVPSQTLRT